MAGAAITSLMATISLTLGNQSHLAGDDRKLIKVLYRELDSLRTLAEETDMIIRLKYPEAHIAQAMVESKFRVVALLKIMEEFQEREATFLSQIHRNTIHRSKEKQGKIAYAAVTSLMATISLSLGHQSLYLRGDDKELVEVLYGKLDSLTTLVEQTDMIIRDHKALKALEAHTTMIAYTAEGMVELELTKQGAYTALLEIIKKSQERTKATLTHLRETLLLSKVKNFQL